MERLIKKISKDIEIVYDRGSFDEWCVFIKNGKTKTAPRDVEYFNFFKKLGESHSNQQVYDDYIKIYDLVSENIENEVIDLIIDIAKNNYDASLSKEVATNFIVIYAGMVAEKNKKYAVLKERIKRLGMHQILMEGYDTKVAANYSKGKKATELDLICKKYGF